MDETGGGTDEVVAVVSPRSRGGVSLFDAEPVTSATVDRFTSDATVRGEARRELLRLGFRVLQEGPVTWSIGGPRALFDRTFPPTRDPAGPRLATGRLAELIEGAALPEPPVHHASGQPPAVAPAAGTYPYLRLPDDVAAVLGAVQARAMGVTGQGVRVAMVDAFAGHPFYALHGFTVRPVILGPGAAHPEVDISGHGTGIAANVFAVAPGVELQPVKVGPDSAGALDAAAATGARVISVSWGHHIDQPGRRMPPFAAAIAGAIAHAAASGVVVCVAAGNHGDRSFPAGHPDVLACGGVMVDLPGGGLRASDHASSFDSVLFPGRHVPDVCGLVGQDVGGRAPLLMLPVPPGSDLDRQFAAPGAGAPADGTAPDDGWALLSGTSSAAPQVAGAAALALQLRPELSPAEVRALLTAHARDVTTGASATGDLAGPGPDAATGAGLIDVAGLARSLRGSND